MNEKKIITHLNSCRVDINALLISFCILYFPGVSYVKAKIWPVAGTGLMEAY